MQKFDNNLKNIVIAFDIGGTNMRVGFVESSTIISRTSISTLPKNGIENAAERLSEVALKNPLMSSSNIVGIGVSTAGPINPKTGVYNHPPNLHGWHNKTMKPLLKKNLDLPVWIGHDATLAALAETRIGRHKGTKNLIYVTISTGVGGGIIADGEMVTGATGGAGEVGHILVRSDGINCNVDCTGCFEGNASGPAIKKLALSKIKEGRKTILHKNKSEEIESITPEAVILASIKGDKFSEEIIMTVIENIAQGLSSLLNIFEPEALVVGGGVMKGLKHRWGEIVKLVTSTALPRYRTGAPVYITEMGDDIGILGATQLVYKNLYG